MSAKRPRKNAAAAAPGRTTPRTARATRAVERDHWRAATIRACGAGVAAAALLALVLGVLLARILSPLAALVIAVFVGAAAAASDARKVLDAIAGRSTEAPRDPADVERDDVSSAARKIRVVPRER